MPIGRLFRLASLLAICVIAFSTPLFADGVYSFTNRSDSFFDKPIHFTDTDSLSFGSHAFSEFRTYGLDQDHWNWIGDLDDDHGKGRRWHHHFHYGDGDGWWNFGDQDYNDGTGGNTGSAGASGIASNSSVAVPEPTVLVLLSTVLAAFLLKSLSKAVGLIRA